MSFKTCSHAKILLVHNLGGVKIVHEQAFGIGTCLEGDSARPPSWIARLCRDSTCVCANVHDLRNRWIIHYLDIVLNERRSG